MGEYSKAFVAFDVAKTKHAVVIADGGRGREVRFVGEVANSPAAVERLVRKLAGPCLGHDGTTAFMPAMESAPSTPQAPRNRGKRHLRPQDRR